MLDSPIGEIKQKIDIVDLIQEYFPLKQAGVNFKARCPFHQEKTPSFFVSRERQIFHCFGACQTGGDIFKFVMMMEGLEFGDALRFLAKKAGVVLRRQDPQLQTKRAKLLEILDLSSQFYHQALLKSKSGEAARQYIKERKIDDLICDQFRLGFAPDMWDELYKFLRKKGFKDNDILDSGLVIKKQPQSLNASRYTLNADYFDRFRNRLIFSIFDVHNNVVGFGGRILPGGKIFKENEEPAKYINTPQTFVYDKSRVLYGLNFAKQEIRKQKKAIVVEGYMDVITSHQVGVRNVVAASGTALTLSQAQLLKRYCENAVLAFDMDLAGDSATKRGIDLAISSGLNVKIARVPEGKDPDEFIKTAGKDAWQKVIDGAISIMDYYFKSTFENLDLEKVENKKKAAEILLPVIAKFPNPIEQTHYLQKLAKEILVSEEDLRGSFENFKKKIKKYEKGVAKTEDFGGAEILAKKQDEDLVLKQIFSLIFRYPKNFEVVKNQIREDYLEGDFKILYKIFYQEYTKKQEIDFGEFNEKLKKIKTNLSDLAGEIYLFRLREYPEACFGELVATQGSNQPQSCRVGGADSSRNQSRPDTPQLAAGEASYYEKNLIPENEIPNELERLVLRFCESFFKKRLQEIEEKMISAEKEKDSGKIKSLSLSFSEVSRQLHNLTLQKTKKTF
jgi:DNA primase